MLEKLSDESTRSGELAKVEHTNVCLMTRSGIQHLDGSPASSCLEGLATSVALQTKAMELFVAVNENKLARVRNDTIVEFVKVPFTITALFEKENGEILVGTNQGRLFTVTFSGTTSVLTENSSMKECVEASNWYVPWDNDDFDLHSLISTPNGNLYAAIHVGGLIVSYDNGENWESIKETCARIVTDQSGVIRVRDGKEINPDVHDITTDPNSSDTLLLATAEGFYLSEDGGSSFQKKNCGINDDQLDFMNYQRSLSFFSDRKVLIVATCSGPDSYHDSQLYRSLDMGESWELVHNFYDKINGHVDTIRVVSPGYALALAGSQVFESLDYGFSWKRLESAPDDFYRSRFHHLQDPLLIR